MLSGTRPANAPGQAFLTVDELCRLYARRIYKFAQLISKDSADAEDLAQDALERAIKGLQTFDPARGEVEGWLWRIVVNAARDAGRIARRQRFRTECLTCYTAVSTDQIAVVQVKVGRPPRQTSQPRCGVHQEFVTRLCPGDSGKRPGSATLNSQNWSGPGI